MIRLCQLEGKLGPLGARPSAYRYIARGFVLTADHVPPPFDCVGQVHHGADCGRPGWAQAVQGSISIYGPAVQYPDREWMILGQWGQNKGLAVFGAVG